MRRAGVGSASGSASGSVSVSAPGSRLGTASAGGAGTMGIAGNGQYGDAMTAQRHLMGLADVVLFTDLDVFTHKDLPWFQLCKVGVIPTMLKTRPTPNDKGGIVPGLLYIGCSTGCVKLFRASSGNISDIFQSSGCANDIVVVRAEHSKAVLVVDTAWANLVVPSETGAPVTLIPKDDTYFDLATPWYACECGDQILFIDGPSDDTLAFTQNFNLFSFSMAEGMLSTVVRGFHVPSGMISMNNTTIMIAERNTGNILVVDLSQPTVSVGVWCHINGIRSIEGIAIGPAGTLLVAATLPYQCASCVIVVNCRGECVARLETPRWNPAAIVRPSTPSQPILSGGSPQPCIRSVCYLDGKIVTCFKGRTDIWALPFSVATEQ